MRIVTLRAERTEPVHYRFAVVLESGAILPLGSLADVAPSELPDEVGRLCLGALLELDPGLGAVRDALATADPAQVAAAALTPDRLRLGPPVPDPSKVVGIGYNYLDHIREQGLPRPDRPILFSKFASSIVADGEPVRRPAGTHALDQEAELAVVIGRRASHVRADRALDYVFGYTVGNDVTARDWQGQKAALREGEQGDRQWFRAKGSDTFLPLGPAIVTADELGDGRGLAVRSWRTPAAGPDAGREMQLQDGTTSDLLFGVAELIEQITAAVSLEPGDIVLSGTPSGVGVFRRPPVFFEPGDVMRVEVERIGQLVNPVADADGRIPEGTPAARLAAERSTAWSAIEGES